MSIIELIADGLRSIVEGFSSIANSPVNTGLEQNIDYSKEKVNSYYADLDSNPYMQSLSKETKDGIEKSRHNYDNRNVSSNKQR